MARNAMVAASVARTFGWDVGSASHRGMRVSGTAVVIADGSRTAFLDHVSVLLRGRGSGAKVSGAKMGSLFRRATAYTRHIVVYEVYSSG